MRKLTTEQFIEKARKVHGGTYDYSLVKYINYKSNVSILCKTHGLFTQTPDSHISGSGCSKCGNINVGNNLRIDQESIIKRFKEIHGDKYDYSSVSYLRQDVKVKIICNIHGDFEQIPSNHLRGHGCPKCSNLKISDSLISSREEFINRSVSIHGDKYDYSLVDYKSALSKVLIKCHKHGLFKQIPNSHLQGFGCIKCGMESTIKHNKENPVGWSVSNWDRASKKSKWFDSFKVYIIKCWNDDEEFYKIGRTFLETSRRFRNKNLMPYKYGVIKEIIFDNARDCFNTENYLKRLNKSSTTLSEPK